MTNTDFKHYDAVHLHNPNNDKMLIGTIYIMFLKDLLGFLDYNIEELLPSVAGSVEGPAFQYDSEYHGVWSIGYIGGLDEWLDNQNKWVREDGFIWLGVCMLDHLEEELVDSTS